MLGATPLYLSASFILEEGLSLAELKRIVDSMARAAREAGVPVVTGDTKVVQRGKGDGCAGRPAWSRWCESTAMKE
jgi:hydrogenase expression/formation protein HypE